MRNRCHQCGKILHELPYVCHRCGYFFCSDHHLPENHQCPGRHHIHDNKPHHKRCGYCGRELIGIPYKCHRCGVVLCDHCRLPENHGCKVTYPYPPTTWTPKDTIPSSISWKKFIKQLTLKNFTIVSIVLILIGLIPLVYPQNNYQVLFQSIFGIGVVSFVLAYLLYALKCWGATHQICAILMVTIPLLTYFLATSKIPDSTSNTLFYFAIQLFFYAIISTIVLYLINKVKIGIESYLFKISRRSHSYFIPQLSYSVIGVLVVSFIMVNYGGVALFSDNIKNAFPLTTNYASNSQYIPPTPESHVLAYATPQATQTRSVELPISIATKNYETGLSAKTFVYVLRGASSTINVNLYSGVHSEILSEGTPAACIRYNYDSSPCTNDEINQYLLKYIDESNQEKYLNNLVNSIKSKTSNRDDQARIAISLVQNIPYDYSKLYTVSTDLRYPYEVLYDNTGICEEKSLLLAYLLRELGFGVILFEFKSENHMAVGIKSPTQYSYINSGYAFVESTAPTIITDSQGNYVGVGKLTSTPLIYHISDGSSMTSVSEEYNDANTYHQVYNQITQIHNTYGSVLDQYQYSQWLSLDNQWRSLCNKYGIKILTSS